MRFLLLTAVATCALFSTAFAEQITYRTIGPVDVSQLPFITDDERKEIQGVLDNPQVKPTYVLAISETGKMANAWGFGTTGDRIQRAMHICEHWSGGLCGLAIVDGKMAEFTLLPRQITYTNRFNVDAVPFVIHRYKNHLRDYANARRHKALAMNYNGFFRYSYAFSSEYQAKQNALGWCQRDSSGYCFLYAVNGKVVFNPGTDIFSGR